MALLYESATTAEEFAPVHTDSQLSTVFVRPDVERMTALSFNLTIDPVAPPTPLPTDPGRAKLLAVAPETFHTPFAFVLVVWLYIQRISPSTYPWFVRLMTMGDAFVDDVGVFAVEIHLPDVHFALPIEIGGGDLAILMMSPAEILAAIAPDVRVFQAFAQLIPSLASSPFSKST